ncbi:MAG TPA: DUF4124 domain-containing protein [Candidatus Methylomirabilis sp.]|nr:DUF4124 domain-containing protein [Candidatus Methylomirabilis sp.]
MFPNKVFPRRFVRPFFPAVVFAPPVIYGGVPYWDSSYSSFPGSQPFDNTPPYYDPTLGYGYAPPVMPTATVGVAPAAPPPPAENVVEYATGRYELRGDGMSMPYAWVWIPNPPSGPPGSPRTAEAEHELYRWVDDQGVLHITDRLNAVPPQYRNQAKQTPR